MQTVLALQVISTGETIVTEATDKTAVSWQKRWERKIMKSQRRADRFKDAIAANDTIVAWVNFDAIQAACSRDELRAIHARVFRGYDLYFSKRVESVNESAAD